MFFLSVAIDADDLSTEPADGHECFKVRDSEIDLSPLRTVKVMLTYHSSVSRLSSVYIWCKTQNFTKPANRWFLWLLRKESG